MLSERVHRARAVAALATIKSKDRLGRVRALTAPGKDCYRLVLIGRVSSHPFPKLSAECNKQTSIGLIPCEGNGRGTICYHSIGSVERALAENGVRVQAWFKHEADMIRDMNLKQYHGSRIGYCFAKRNGALRAGLWFIWRRV